MSTLAYKAETLFHRIIPTWLFNPRYRRVYRMPCTFRVGDTPLPQQFAIRWAVDGDREALVKRDILNARRWEIGDRAAIISANDRLAAKVWIATGVYRDWDTGISIDLAPNEAWLYAAWVHRDFRGQHLYSHLVSFVLDQLRSQSIESLLLTIDWSNGHSHRVHHRFGARPIGALYGVTLCGSRNFKLRINRN